MATVANLNGFSASILAVQMSAFSGLFLAIKARDVMPTINSFRMYRSPFLVIFQGVLSNRSTCSAVSNPTTRPDRGQS